MVIIITIIYRLDADVIYTLVFPVLFWGGKMNTVGHPEEQILKILNKRLKNAIIHHALPNTHSIKSPAHKISNLDLMRKRKEAIIIVERKITAI